MIILAGIQLNAEPNSDMLWQERYSFQKVAQAMERTLGGRLIVFSGGLIEGMPITLQSEESYGWMKRSVLDQIIELSETVSGEYTLSYGGRLYNIMFRHADAPAIDMQPLNPRQTPDADDFFIGQIKLITV